MSMEDRHAETRNEDHNLARLLRNTQREAEICAGYALEAEAAGDKRLAGFFQEVQTMHESVIEKAEAILVKEARANFRVVPVRVDPDPGDVSPARGLPGPVGSLGANGCPARRSRRGALGIFGVRYKLFLPPSARCRCSSYILNSSEWRL